MSHITGGGLVENVPRMLPKSVTAEIDLNAWQVPELFKWMKKAGGVPTSDIAKTLNMGIGMVMIVEASKVKEVEASLASAALACYTIGRLVKRGEDQGCVLLHQEAWDF